jgi:penicillin amidase
LARDYVGSPWSWTALERYVRDEVPAPWWDDTTTPGVETADGQMLAALDAAGADLRATLGDPPAWRWGVLHTATFAEQTFGNSGIAPVESYMNRGPVEVPGAAGAVNNTYYQLSRGYADPTDPESVPVGLGGLFTVTNLPSYRLLIDMGDIDGARIVITTGQSGNPFHAHYDDQIDPWRTGQTLPFPFTPAAVAAATVDTLTLRPGP